MEESKRSRAPLLSLMMHAYLVGGREVVLRFEPLEQHRGLRLVIVEVDHHERCRTSVDALALRVEACLNDPDLNEVLVLRQVAPVHGLHRAPQAPARDGNKKHTACPIARTGR